MLILPEQRLVFFAIPKTGSTAYQQALVGHVDLALQTSPERKHMNVRQFNRLMAPALGRKYAQSLERFAVMRYPLDRIRSWYRYRTRLPANWARSTATMTFSDFVEAYLSPEPPEFAAIGDQWTFTNTPEGRVGIDHLFAIEYPETLHAFIAERTGALGEVPKKNVSPDAPTDIGEDLAAALREAYAEEYALYDSVADGDGYLFTDRSV
ncbi:MAG: sulfotransferase family 2 domain-containing protein [Pseudomonadota bacterium]